LVYSFFDQELSEAELVLIITALQYKQIKQQRRNFKRLILRNSTIDYRIYFIDINLRSADNFVIIAQKHKFITEKNKI